MALVEVARVWDLAEARVARSALEAAGFTIFIFDEHRAGAVWNEQLTLGGIRLMGPEEEADDARQLIGQANEVAREPVTRSSGQAGAREWVAGLAALIVCSVFGWTLVGFKRRDWFHRISAACLVAVIAVTFITFRIVR